MCVFDPFAICSKGNTSPPTNRKGALATRAMHIKPRYLLTFERLTIRLAPLPFLHLLPSLCPPKTFDIMKFLGLLFLAAFAAA